MSYRPNNFADMKPEGGRCGRGRSVLASYFEIMGCEAINVEALAKVRDIPGLARLLSIAANGRLGDSNFVSYAYALRRRCRRIVKSKKSPPGFELRGGLLVKRVSMEGHNGLLQNGR